MINENICFISREEKKILWNINNILKKENIFEIELLDLKLKFNNNVINFRNNNKTIFKKKSSNLSNQNEKMIIIKDIELEQLKIIWKTLCEEMKIFKSIN